MSGSDFKLTDSTRAVFLCGTGVVQFYFVVNDEQVGKTFLYNLEEAAALGFAINKIGAWDECPVEIEVSDLRSFGQRLRDYGVNGY
jgi:hypothetical protein